MKCVCSVAPAGKHRVQRQHHLRSRRLQLKTGRSPQIRSRTRRSALTAAPPAQHSTAQQHLHSSTVHTALYSTALHSTALHCTALHCTTRHGTALHCTAPHCTALHNLHCSNSYPAALPQPLQHCHSHFIFNFSTYVVSAVSIAGYTFTLAAPSATVTAIFIGIVRSLLHNFHSLSNFTSFSHFTSFIASIFPVGSAVASPNASSASL